MHGPLSELDPTTGYDQASLVCIQLPVPAKLTVKPPPIPRVGLGVFATTFIGKGVWLGPYKGKTVDKDDIGDLRNTVHACKHYLCMDRAGLSSEK